MVTAAALWEFSPGDGTMVAARSLPRPPRLDNLKVFPYVARLASWARAARSHACPTTVLREGAGLRERLWSRLRMKFWWLFIRSAVDPCVCARAPPRWTKLPGCPYGIPSGALLALGRTGAAGARYNKKLRVDPIEIACMFRPALGLVLYLRAGWRVVVRAGCDAERRTRATRRNVARV